MSRKRTAFLFLLQYPLEKLDILFNKVNYMEREIKKGQAIFLIYK